MAATTTTVPTCSSLQLQHTVTTETLSYAEHICVFSAPWHVCTAHVFRSLLAIYKWCRYLERMVAAISSFLFFSVPAPHVFGFFTQLWWIQVGWSVDKRNWPILVRTTMNTSKNTKNMERLKNTERFKEYRMLLRIRPSLASLYIGYHGYRI